MPRPNLTKVTCCKLVNVTVSKLATSFAVKVNLQLQTYTNELILKTAVYP